MGDQTVTKSEVSVLINEAFERYIPRIAEECKRNDELAKAQCQAHQVFGNTENVKTFFAIQNKVDNHIESHRKRDAILWKIISFLFGSVVYQFVKDFFLSK